MHEVDCAIGIRGRLPERNALRTTLRLSRLGAQKNLGKRGVACFSAGIITQTPWPIKVAIWGGLLTSGVFPNVDFGDWLVNQPQTST
jgi:hypothetical protein